MVNENPGILRSNVRDPEIVRGQWIHLEIHARNASADGVNDGLVRWWVNGELAGDHPNIERPALPWTEFHGNPVWGGSGGVVQKDQFLWMNNLFLAGRP
jgi:hypothetical protein